MFDILFSPLKAIASAKSERSIGKTMLVLLVASLLAAIDFFLITKKFSGIYFLIALGILLGTFLGILFLAVLLQLTIYVISQRGGYFEALTTLSYGCFIMASGYLVSSILGLVPYIGIVLSGIIILFATILSITVMLRAAIELFQIDLLTAIIALIIINTAIFLAIYFVLLRTLLFGGLFGMPGFGAAPGLGTVPLGGLT